MTTPLGAAANDPAADQLATRLNTLDSALREIQTALAATDLSSSDLHQGFEWLGHLDTQVPQISFTDLMQACEVIVTVTGPLAIATGETAAVASASTLLLPALRSWVRITAQLRARGLPDNLDPRMRPLVLALAQPELTTALERMTDQVHALASAPSSAAGSPVKRQSRVNRIAVPLVVGIALSMLFFLIVSVALATSRVPAKTHGASVPGVIVVTTTPSGGSPHATATPNGKPPATAVPGSGTPGATSTPPSSASPTPTPRASPTPIPRPAPPPSMAVSQLNHALCNDATFTITYLSGSGSVSWLASSDNPANIQLSPNDESYGGQVAGVLDSAGQSFIIYVEDINNGNFSGNITVSFDRGGAPRYVSYNTSACGIGSFLIALAGPTSTPLALPRHHEGGHFPWAF